MRLLAESYTTDKNTLISPLSVLSALAMVANGAEGDTLAQMETVFGLNVDTLNSCLKAYTDALPKSEKSKLSLANSIWFTDDARFTVNDDFLQTNADYYGADIFKAPFNPITKNKINSWVKEKTDGMISEILDDIPAEAVMYLVNALAFEAEWDSIYKKTQVHDSIFTTESGDERKIKMMHSDEYGYIGDENASGFIKYYKGRNYAFAALLPNEGTSVGYYIESLTGEALHSMLTNPENVSVDAGIPKFEFEFDAELSSVLLKMGMTNAFHDELADFSSLGKSTAGNIFISRVLHKTFISVAERGTKAGAATVVEMTDKGMSLPGKSVILDRPFVFMLIDTETSLPFFIGTVMDIK